MSPASAVADQTVAMTPEVFRPHVGTQFAIAVDSGEPIVLTLDAVEPRGTPHELRAEPFALVFSGPMDRMAPQATLALAHEELGDLELFLVPTGPGAYEAVFN